jgi:hypothetical protein
MDLKILVRRESEEIQIEAKGMDKKEFLNVMDRIIPHPTEATYNDIKLDPDKYGKLVLTDEENLPEGTEITFDQETLDKIKAEQLNEATIKKLQFPSLDEAIAPKKKGFGQFNTKKLPILKETEGTATSIGELLAGKMGREEVTELVHDIDPSKTPEAGKEGIPDFYKTGKKYNDKGDPKYKTHYECPKCYETGRHYVYLTTKKVACHNCSSTLEVVRANDVPVDSRFEMGEEHRDEQGNFFKATELIIS